MMMCMIKFMRFHGGHFEFRMIVMSSKISMCFIVFLDTEIYELVKKIKSLSQILRKIC